MSLAATLETPIADFRPQLETFRDDFIKGLSSDPRFLYPKYFYDAVGSRLFDQICELDEYFPTRTELAILANNADAIRDAVGLRSRIVEFGSGSTLKTRLLLKNLDHPAAYLPIEISKQCLRQSARALALEFPDLEILPICADYTADFALTESDRDYDRTTIYFPGSTIGNFEPDEAQGFLRQARVICGPACGLLIGIGLQTDKATLELAYNDRAGVTAAFNQNILSRAKRELGARVDPSGFAHWAGYDTEKGRIEMRLVSKRPQRIQIDDTTFDFATGDPIRTEYSHKFTIDGFAALAKRAGFDLQQGWTDPQQRFAILHFESH